MNFADFVESDSSEGRDLSTTDDKFRVADHPLRMVYGTIHDTTTGSAADRIQERHWNVVRKNILPVHIG